MYGVTRRRYTRVSDAIHTHTPSPHSIFPTPLDAAPVNKTDTKQQPHSTQNKQNSSQTTQTIPTAVNTAHNIRRNIAFFKPNFQYIKNSSMSVPATSLTDVSVTVQVSLPFSKNTSTTLI
jgi:hypothetical protein